MEWFEVKNNIYACLEIGSAMTKLMICNIRQERLYVLAQASIKTDGIERGNVVNVTQAVETLKELKQRVERDLNQELSNVYLSIPSIDVNLDNVKSSMNLRANKPINTNEIKQLFRNIVNQPIYRDQVVVNIVPRAFVVDEKSVIQNPIGILGKKLLLRAQKVTTSASLVYNLINVVELAGFRFADIVLGSVAETMYVLTQEQLNEGACLINIGHSMTTVTLVKEGRLLKTVSLLLGGQDITNEISKKFNVSKQTAEELKVNFGRLSLTELSNEIVYTEELEGGIICVTRQALAEVMTVQYEQVLKTVKQFLIESGHKQDVEQFVLTGGASEALGLVEIARHVLNQEITIRRPSMLGVRHSMFTTLVGMATYSHELSMLIGSKNMGINLEQYLHDVEVKHIEQNFSSKAVPEEKIASKTFMESKLENSGVLVRLFDMIFDEKEE